MNERRYRLAVDVGGTFTDVVLADRSGGNLLAVKVPTTPDDRAEGVMSGIAAAAEAAGIDRSSIEEVVHGSTTGTNALIERTGARVGFLTTRGFRDMIEIGRIQRPMEGLYDINNDRPPPLTPRDFCAEADERVGAAGEVLTPIDPASVEKAAALFERKGVEAIAVCFLFSHINPEHERIAGALLAERFPGMPISLSSDVCPEYREYERASTTVMNAYLTPVIRAYLETLRRRIEAEAGGARLSVIQANGGSTSVDRAMELTVSTVNSGPAGGVVAAAFYGRTHEREQIVSVDMGGTSFDIGIIEGGASRVTTEGSFQGLPVKVPIVDLHIIGAGGGSIAWIDPGGALNVGPRSAGSRPGPACYGFGGEDATVTDANVALGRLNPENFNAGRMRLDVEAARRSVANLADRMGVPLEDAALGILKVVNANMVKGIATVTIQRGIDVRDFSLCSFGGAGGVHAVDLARELQMRETIIPPLPGTFSAVGLLATEMRHDYVTALGGLESGAADPKDIEGHFASMEAEGRDELARNGYEGERQRLNRRADLKVVGQTYELTVPLPDQGTVSRKSIDDLVEAFGALYRQRYAFFFDGEAIEIVNLRLSAEGLNAPIQFDAPSADAGNLEAAQAGTRLVYFEGAGSVDTPIFDRGRLNQGMDVAGPAVIEEPTSATLVPPEFTAHIAADLGIFIAIGSE